MFQAILQAGRGCFNEKKHIM